MKKLLMVLSILVISVVAFADGRLSCRIHGDEDNMAALESNIVCSHLTNGKGYVVEVAVTLEKPAKAETVVYVEVKLNGNTKNARVVIGRGCTRGSIMVPGFKQGDCPTLSIASGSCRL